MLMKLLLFKSGILIKADEDEKYQMTIAASTGELKFDGIRSWLQSNLPKINK